MIFRSHSNMHPDDNKVCEVCGGRVSACNVLGHRPESDRNIQWQTPSPTAAKIETPSVAAPALRELHDRLGAMIDQVGQPDYSLRELVDGLREVRDELLRLAGEKP